MSELLLNLLGAVAQFERSLINERQREGVQIAKLNGAYKGRKREMTDDRVAEIHSRTVAGETKAQIARDLGISRETLYQYLRTAQASVSI
jgi:DNA invertase Pin-like site-specific DNA recombinase